MTAVSGQRSESMTRRRFGHNDVGSSPASKFRGNKWNAVDHAPPAIRHALHEGVVDWCALGASWDYRRALKAGVPHDVAVAYVVRVLRDSDEAEVSEFSCMHLKRFGTRSPHDRAQVTIQRYGRR